MSKSSDRTPVALSGRLYELLLALYPVNHRREYGPPMAQLFHDQCRDAWVEARGWGLTVLWLRVSIDLVKTSTAEHFRNLRPRKSMFNRMLMAFRTNPTLRTTFLALFAVVFLLVLGSSALLAFLAPEQYVGTARIKVERQPKDDSRTQDPQGVGVWDPYFIQAELKTIQSDLILGKVVQGLNLNESVPLLRGRISLVPVRNTGLIEIRVYDKFARQAALIANAIAKSYQDHCNVERLAAARTVVSPGMPVELVDMAVPGLRPVRPNRPLTRSLGIIGGILLASVVGGVGALLVLLSRRLSHPQAATP